MKIMHIAVHGDNDELHDRALAAACNAVREVNGMTNVWRAWIEDVSKDEAARALATGDRPR